MQLFPGQFIVLSSSENCVQAWRLKTEFFVLSVKNDVAGVDIVGQICSVDLFRRCILNCNIVISIKCTQVFELSHRHLKIALLVYVCMYIIF
jgi:hypothetical protein